MAMDFSKSKNNILKEVVKKNTEEGNTKIIKNIPLEDIEENPVNELIFNMDGIEQLADTIKHEGFTGSIEVVALPNGKYQIFSGHRRYRAVKLLGYPTIPCTIEDKPNDTMLMRKLLSSNIQTRKMLPLDYARAITEYEKVLKAEGFKGDKREEIARFFNTSGGQIYRYMAISRMIPRLQEMTNEPEFPYTAFLDANKFDKKQQEELADRIEHYMSEHPDSGIPRVVIQQFCRSIIDESEREQKIKEELKKSNETISSAKPENEPGIPDDIDDSPITGGSFVSELSGDSDEEPDEPVETEDKKATPSELKKERIKESILSIDFDVIRVAGTLSKGTSGEFTIQNKKEVSRAINEIEEAIEKLKEML